jgi:hypothetical protein
MRGSTVGGIIARKSPAKIEDFPKFNSKYWKNLSTAQVLHAGLELDGSHRRVLQTSATL